MYQVRLLVLEAAQEALSVALVALLAARPARARLHARSAPGAGRAGAGASVSIARADPCGHGETTPRGRLLPADLPARVLRLDLEAPPAAILEALQALLEAQPDEGAVRLVPTGDGPDRLTRVEAYGLADGDAWELTGYGLDGDPCWRLRVPREGLGAQEEQDLAGLAVDLRDGDPTLPKRE